MAAFLFALAWRRSAVGQRTNPLPLTRTCCAQRSPPIEASFSGVKQALGHLALLIARQVIEDDALRVQRGTSSPLCRQKKSGWGKPLSHAGKDRIMRRVGAIVGATQAQLAPAGVLFNCQVSALSYTDDWQRQRGYPPNS